MKKANKEAGTNMNDPNTSQTITKVSTILHNKRLTLLGHIIRSDANDPLRQVTFENDKLKSSTPALQRVGRRRSKWFETTIKEAWKNMSNVDFTESEAQRTQIKIQAVSRIIPFSFLSNFPYNLRSQIKNQLPTN